MLPPTSVPVVLREQQTGLARIAALSVHRIVPGK